MNHIKLFCVIFFFSILAACGSHEDKVSQNESQSTQKIEGTYTGFNKAGKPVAFTFNSDGTVSSEKWGTNIKVFYKVREDTILLILPVTTIAWILKSDGSIIAGDLGILDRH